MCPPSVQVCLGLVQTLKYTLQNRFVREKANLRLRVFADIAWDQAPQRGKEGKKRGNGKNLRDVKQDAEPIAFYSY